MDYRLTRLLAAIQRAPLVPEHLIDQFTRWRPHSDAPLTQRERDVLTCLSHGLTLSMAAEVLGRTTDAVAMTARSARYKLRAKNQAHAVALALRKDEIR